VPFVLLPLIPVARRMAPLGGGGWAALAYFSAIGAGYILIEIDLFHLLSVVLGNPTYTFATVLATLLLATCHTNRPLTSRDGRTGVAVLDSIRLKTRG